MLLVIKAVFIILGLALLREIRLSMSSIRAERWRRAEGLLENAAEKPHDSLQTDIEYNFAVDGENYSATRIGFGFPLRLTELIAKKEFANVMAQAPELTVYYDPRNPNKSALLAGFKPFHAIKIVPLLILFMLTGITAFGF